MLKKNEAMSLISLIITIVVVLMLSSVTLFMLTGENGLFVPVQSKETNNTREKIVSKINTALNSISKDIKNNSESSLDEIISKIQKDLEAEYFVSTDSSKEPSKVIIKSRSDKTIKGEVALETGLVTPAE